MGAGIFHHFHLEWIGDLSRVLNRGLLPGDYYALAEEPAGGILLAASPPRVKLRSRAEPDVDAARARSVVIRHASNHRIVAILEIVSPGNKSSRHAIAAFLDKAVQILRAGIYLIVVDLFPPGPRDPQGIHTLIWDEFIDNDFALPSSRSPNYRFSSAQRRMFPCRWKPRISQPSRPCPPSGGMS